MCSGAEIGYILTAAGSIWGASEQSKSAKKAGKAGKKALTQQIGYARESRDLALQLSDPARQAGYAATAAMMDMMGLPRTSPGGGGGYPAGAYSYGGDLPQLKYNVSKGWGPDDWFKSSKKKPRWRKYANQLEEYLGGDLPEGLYEGKNDRTKPRKGAKRKVWRQYAESLLPVAQQAQAERIASGAFFPPGVTAPNLGAYEEYDWKTDPGYDFRFNEGIRARDASASARGITLAGGYGKSLIGYGQDMASQEYMNIYNRLATLAGYGQTGVVAGSNAAQNFGGAVGAAYGDYGATRASGYTAEGNIRAGMISDLTSLLSGINWGGGGNTLDEISWDTLSPNINRYYPGG